MNNIFIINSCGVNKDMFICVGIIKNLLRYDYNFQKLVEFCIQINFFFILNKNCLICLKYSPNDDGLRSCRVYNILSKQYINTKCVTACRVILDQY